MQIERANNTNFQGKLVIKNRLSNKPRKYIEKVRGDIENLIRSKDYNLYIAQDYNKNEINLAADYPFPYKPSQLKILSVDVHESIPVTAKRSMYIEASKKAISKHENAMRDAEQKVWEQNHKSYRIPDLEEIAGTIVLLPLFVINNILHSMNPKWSKNFEKYIEKII